MVFYLTTYVFLGSMPFLQTRTWSLVETFGGRNLSTGGLLWNVGKPDKISYHVIDMISFQFILFLHILLASTSICIFLFRAISALFFPRKNQFFPLKKLTIGIDSLLTITGITQIIYLNYQPLNQYWFWLKMGALIIYILAGILALRNHQAFYRRIGFLSIALSAVVIIIVMATRKPF